jgi:hypothetical protein
VKIAGFLRKEGINKYLVSEVAQIRDRHPVDPGFTYRIPKPRFYYYGNDIWEEAITALLCGENLLLVGPKATGKICPGRKSSNYFWQAKLGYLFSYQHRFLIAHWH